MYRIKVKENYACAPVNKMCWKCKKQFVGNFYERNNICPKCKRKWSRTKKLYNIIRNFIKGYQRFGNITQVYNAPCYIANQQGEEMTEKELELALYFLLGIVTFFIVSLLLMTWKPKRVPNGDFENMLEKKRLEELKK